MALDLPQLIGVQLDTIWTQLESLTESATILFPDENPIYDADKTEFAKNEIVVENVDIIPLAYNGKDYSAEEKVLIRTSELSGNTFVKDCEIQVGETFRRVVDYEALPTLTDAKLIIAYTTKAPA